MLGFALFLSFWSASPAKAVTPCADPVTWLQICCPKPCPITDPKAFVEHTFKGVLEDLKLATMFKEALAWKEQLEEFGKSISAINGLINNIMGTARAGISAFQPSARVPGGLQSNPLNISQTAGAIARMFMQPAETATQSVVDAKARGAMVSDGYVDGLATSLDARAKLENSAEDIKKIAKVIEKGKSSGLTSGNDAENVRSDFAAMNQARLGMLQALQNAVNIGISLNSTESYNALGSLGADHAMKSSSWGSASAPSSPYGSNEQGLAKTLNSGVGNKDAAYAQRAAADQAFQAYDNLTERAVQIHNAAAAYIGMMKTVALNQETVAHYELSRNMASQQRAIIQSGLVIFYLDPAGAFDRMAVQTVGPDGMSGMNPYQWADSFAQQPAAQMGQNAVVGTALINPAAYGETVCEDEIVNEGGDGGGTKKVAKFKLPLAANAPKKVAEIYANPAKLLCGELLAKWLSLPQEPVFDVYNDQAKAEAYGPDVNRTTTTDEAATKAAKEELFRDNPNAGMDQAFKYWINLTKRSLWYYDFACGTTLAADPADQGQCEIYDRNSNPNARAGGAQGVINNLYRAIDGMVATINDPELTLVLQKPELQGRPPVEITRYEQVRGELDYLIPAGAQKRSEVDAAIMAEPMYANRDNALQAAIGAIRQDPGFTRWTNAIAVEAGGAGNGSAGNGAASSTVDANGCGANPCWGLERPDWNNPVTISGFTVPMPEPSPALPVAALQINCADPSEALYCVPVESSGVPYPIRPQTAFEPTVMVAPPYVTQQR
jgi:hypothetical protein